MKTGIMPNIYDFKDPILYIEAVFKKFQLEKSELSLSKWAIQLGFKSPEALSEILKRKKKLSSNVVSLLSDNFGLDNSEKTFFEVLIKYSQAQTVEDKKIMELVLAELTQLQGPKVKVEDMNIFSHWVYMVIISMAKVKDIHCSKDTIRQFLMEDVSQDLIDLAVDQMVENGLLIYNENGSLAHPSKHVVSKNDSFQFSPHPYFEQVSELAKVGSKVPADEREFQCFTIAISDEDMPAFKMAMRNFRAKIGDLSPVNTANRVYQCNLQLFPLTRKLETALLLKSAVDVDLEKHHS